nr:MAG TPA: hypothetical protein [Caudoviricetes sp.]
MERHGMLTMLSINFINGRQNLLIFPEKKKRL